MTSVHYQTAAISARHDERSLRQRIEVELPYFALREVQFMSEAAVVATVDREYDMGLEAGVISTAEAGRHLAILGSLAAASLQPTAERHFYLAHRARVLAFRLPEGTTPVARGLRASATATLQRRTARAECRLTLPSGEPLFVMTVDYKVMVEHLFMRFVAKPGAAPADDAATIGRDAPKRDAPVLTLADVERRSGNEAHASLTVREADCAGHFPGCPALPVAKLMHALALVSGSLMRPESDTSDAPCYLPQVAEIEADSLAFAGERLELHAALESRSEQSVVTRVTAESSSGARVGAGRFTMRPCR